MSERDFQTYTVAHLYWEDDDITALYRGGELIMEGDERIEGFFVGLNEAAGYDYARQDIYVSDFDDEAPLGLRELLDNWDWAREPE